MTMIRGLVVVAAGACVASAVCLSPAHAEGGIRGSWEATDVPDGSHMTLSVQGSQTRVAVHWVDESASVCDGAPANVTGSGTINGDSLDADLTIACRDGGNVFRHRVPFYWDYDAGSGTLTAADGVVWTRA